MVGYAFMGRAHSLAWRTVDRVFDLPLRPRLAAICGRDKAAAQAAADRLGWAAAETDWRALIARDDVQLIDISAPGDLHAPIAIAALAAGKHVLCEKPLANTLAEAEAMKAAADAAYPAARGPWSGFNYRRVPALALARRLVEQGRIGTLRHFRAVYLQDWLADPDAPMTWRMQAERAGSGALGDLGAHIVDLARYLTGDEITGVSAVSATFTRQRPLRGRQRHRAGHGGRRGGVHRAVRLRRAGLVRGDPVRRRAQERAAGRAQRVGGQPRVRPRAAQRARVLRRRRTTAPAGGFRRILVTEASHPYLSAWWPPGHILGWEHTFTHQARDLLTAIADGGQPPPSFADGLAVQRVLDAVARSAAAGNSWESVIQLMARPFTLFTGQWADLPLEEVCRLASSWGYDGLEIACWGDHFEVDRALREDGYLAGRHALLDKYGLKCWAISATWSARRSATTRSTSGTRASCPRGSGATASPRGCGSGRRPRSRTPRGRRPRSACGP